MRLARTTLVAIAGAIACSADPGSGAETSEAGSDAEVSSSAASIASAEASTTEAETSESSASTTIDAATCGNDVVDAGEHCDGVVNGGPDCPMTCRWELGDELWHLDLGPGVWPLAGGGAVNPNRVVAYADGQVFAARSPRDRDDDPALIVHGIEASSGAPTWTQGISNLGDPGPCMDCNALEAMVSAIALSDGAPCVAGMLVGALDEQSGFVSCFTADGENSHSLVLDVPTFGQSRVTALASGSSGSLLAAATTDAIEGVDQLLLEIDDEGVIATQTPVTTAEDLGVIGGLVFQPSTNTTFIQTSREVQRRVGLDTVEWTMPAETNVTLGKVQLLDESSVVVVGVRTINAETMVQYRLFGLVASTDGEVELTFDDDTLPEVDSVTGLAIDGSGTILVSLVSSESAGAAVVSLSEGGAEIVWSAGNGSRAGDIATDPAGFVYFLADDAGEDSFLSWVRKIALLPPGGA